MATALIVIDVQNDYFTGGKFPLWNPEAAEANCLRLIGWAKSASVPVVLVQHVVEGTPAPFFAAGSVGAEIHGLIRSVAADAPVIVKTFADSFEKTDLQATLEKMGVDRLVICGMMTHNCVTHTAISKAAEAYDVTVVGDACATVSEIIHILALHALSTRVKLIETDELITKDPQ
ncbi:isochorismatase family protein [bacterium]|nr:isochorismatase family protein [bacterium]